MSDMRSFIKVSHERFTLILRKGMLPFHWIALRNPTSTRTKVMSRRCGSAPTTALYGH